MTGIVSQHVPPEVAPIADLMSTFQAPWALCGGWAVDAWLDQLTRNHGDVDIAVFVHDQRVLYEHLAGWQLVAHVPGLPDDTPELWDGQGPLGLPGHLHCRLDTGEELPDRVFAAADQGFRLDIQLNERSGKNWTLLNEPPVSVPLEQGIRESPWGLPTATPEVLLFFKALELRRRDKLDFAALLPHLGVGQREWLIDAISRVGHPWVSALSS